MVKKGKRAKDVPREEFDRIAGPLRNDLLRLQDELKSEDFPVILMFAGVMGAGKTEALNLINEWMDPRWLVTRAYGPASDEERQRPEYWRFWRDLPPKGRIGLFVGSWYHSPVHDFVYKRIGRKKFDAALDGIAAFERTLADDGALIIKFWLQLDKATQKKRMEAMEKDDLHSWKISKQDWEHFKHNKKFQKANEIAIRKTDTGGARWIVVDGTHPRARSLKILTSVRDAIAGHRERRRAWREVVTEARSRTILARAADLKRIEQTADKLEKESQVAGGKKRSASARSNPSIRTADASNDGRPYSPTILDQLDMSASLSDQKYTHALRALRAELGSLCRELHFTGKSALILFEGPDAAGKGGAIRRLTGSMDARDYRVNPIAAPTDEERRYPYLWRFWRHLPASGRLAIFDRSWYGRVLVERVEGFAQPDEWMRAYEEIKEFEQQLTASGLIVLKFWVHITKDEQYRRFKERELISYKAWKLTPEDWRNRAKWHDYAVAAHEMVERTSTKRTPWTIVEGNDKKVARIKVLETVCDRLRDAVGGKQKR